MEEADRRSDLFRALLPMLLLLVASALLRNLQEQRGDGEHGRNRGGRGNYIYGIQSRPPPQPSPNCRLPASDKSWPRGGDLGTRLG